MIRGIDLSSIQGILSLAHWRAIAQSGVRFASVRCGYGNEAPDSRFAQNLTGARAVGLVVQAYAVGFPLPPDPAHPGREPEAQAARHFEQSGGLGRGAGELAPCLDLEWPAPQDWAARGVDAASIVAWGETYLRTMAALIGRRPYIYIYPDFLKHLRAGADVTPLAAYPLWAAEYGVAEPYVLPPWTGCTMWQRSGGGGRLPNGAAVDEDVFEGTEAAFSSAANQIVDVTDGGVDKTVHPPIDPEAT